MPRRSGRRTRAAAALHAHRGLRALRESNLVHFARDGTAVNLPLRINAASRAAKKNRAPCGARFERIAGVGTGNFQREHAEHR